MCILTYFRFKDETAGNVIRQFCGLRSKSYSIAIETEVKIKDDKGVDSGSIFSLEQKLAAAGVKKCKHSHIPHQDYVEALISSNIKMMEQKTIVSKNHTLYTQVMTRTALSCFDIKRVILSDGITTVPYGYF